MNPVIGVASRQAASFSRPSMTGGAETTWAAVVGLWTAQSSRGRSGIVMEAGKLGATRVLVDSREECLGEHQTYEEPPQVRRRYLAAPRTPGARRGVSTSQVRVQVLFIPRDWKHAATPRATHRLGRAA